ncbi:hypothetical protein ABFT23_19225 [Nocardioides sp. C4-1]|uniref:hypothetical protein n=1 Tax=Nocardioides sp. C4-1 TaxID=3151851 RepID=UPI00326688D8
MKIIESRLAAAIAGGAVVAVLGASVSYAAATIRSADIVNETIRSVDIKNGTIKSDDIKDGSLQVNDLTKQARTKLKGQTGARGPAGPAGPVGPAGPAGDSVIQQVTALDGAWTARAEDAAGVTMTPDGIRFGPFADGGGCDNPGTDFGRLDYDGLNGRPLSSLKSLVYHARYTADDDTGGVGSPTMRVFFDDPTSAAEFDRLTFSPNTQPDGDFAEGPMHEWIVTSGTVRLNDDAGSNPGAEAPWSSFLAEHGDQLITNINILNGCQDGDNLTSLVRRIEINGTTFAFGG